MKKINEEKLIKYLRSLILRCLTVVVIFLILAIASKSSTTYKDIITKNIYEKNFSFVEIKKLYNKYLGGLDPLNKVIDKTTGKIYWCVKEAFEDIGTTRYLLDRAIKKQEPIDGRLFDYYD